MMNVFCSPLKDIQVMSSDIVYLESLLHDIFSNCLKRQQLRHFFYIGNFSI